MKSRQVDLGILGGGSAGFGAALAASRTGLRLAIVERGPQLGGTAVLAGVSNWEPGLGGSPFAKEIYERLASLPAAVNIWSLGRHCVWTPGGYPGGETVPDASRGYDATLLRHGTNGYRTPEIIRERWHGVAFDPEAYSQVLTAMLEEHPRCSLLLNSQPLRVHREKESISAVDISTPEGALTLSAPLWIDASGDAILAGMAGCRRLLGPDPSNRKENTPDTLNAVTLVYRITPISAPTPPPLGAPAPVCDFAARWPMAQIVSLPDGDLSINMLPTMDGREYLAHLRNGTLPAARVECERRVHAHWAYLQHAYPEFHRYRFHSCSPALGVRESYRVECEWMLDVDEIRNGLSQQQHPDIIALADHPLDRHASDSGSCQELTEPYGIPFRSLLAKGVDNLLVAGRCAGFTHQAASSCRLSRTMMALGQAAGTAAALCTRAGIPLRTLSAENLRQHLKAQGVPLCPINP